MSDEPKPKFSISPAAKKKAVLIVIAGILGGVAALVPELREPISEVLALLAGAL